MHRLVRLSGASSFGQFGMQTAEGPRYGLFDSLESWVEKGSPLENVIATKFESGPNGGTKAAFTRPLCATDEAANFACVAP